MHTLRATYGVLIVLPCLAVLLLQGCASSGAQVRYVPENGYDLTRNYQFRATIHADEHGTCEQLVVRVKALNKLYTSTEPPPPRLRLIDDDCTAPIQFERAQYVSQETSGSVNIAGSEVSRFWGDNARLQSELMTWLWQSGII